MKYLCFFMLLLFLNSCRQENGGGCFKSNKPEVTITRTLTQFDEIAVYSVFDIIWKYDSVYSINITCGEKLAENIMTEIISDPIPVLELRNNNHCNWMRSQEKKIRLEIHSPSFSKLTLISPCDFVCNDTIKTPLFTLDDHAGICTVDITVACTTIYFSVHAGTGRLTLRGSAGLAYYYNWGNSYFYLGNFSTDYCYLTTKSTGQSYINVNKELGVSILGRGNVYYKGDPYIIYKTEDGEGRLIKEG